MPQLPFSRAQAVVMTDTVDPLVLTEIPGPAETDPAAGARGSATAAATVRPERRSGDGMRMGTALRRHGRRASLAPPGSGSVRAALRAANSAVAPAACRARPGR
ncbi:hypothetical protein GCM10010377_33110 [Streptomyces viridiviolaceus]|nr:hypothetical protein GCM10010377_33110 [Streptomyces viridiviolaceus]